MKVTKHRSIRTQINQPNINTSTYMGILRFLEGYGRTDIEADGYGRIDIEADGYWRTDIEVVGYSRTGIEAGE